MAVVKDRGTVTLSASILPDNIKTRLTGALSYAPQSALALTSGEGWIYVEVLATSSSVAPSALSYAVSIAYIFEFCDV